MPRRLPSYLLLLPVVLTACGTADTVPRAEPTAPPSAARQSAGAPDTDADQRIRALIIQIWPTGLETSVTARWTTITREVARSSDAAQQALARQNLTDLVSWMQQHQSAIIPPSGDTRGSALTRLVLYMSAYVYGQTIPDVPPGTDAAFAIVNPGQDPPPIVTPTGYAGVDLPANAVNQATIVVVSQRTATYALCAGPLQTTLCQLPRYYTFDEFPHVRLNAPAAFAVCHLRPAGLPWDTDPAFDDGLRLAHTRPVNTADYTPGGTQVDSVELLPLVEGLSFINCAAPPTTTGARGPLRAVSALLADAWSLVAPRTAWAIDLGGGGGLSLSFSDFEVVDPRRTYTLSEVRLDACNAVTFGYSVNGVATDVARKAAGCAAQTFPGATLRVPATADVQLYLRDETCGRTFTQAGSHGAVTGANPYRIAITDAGGDCEFSPTSSRPPGQVGNLTVTETIGGPP